MVAIKSHQAAAFLKKPNPAVTAILVYGTDAGMVAERAKAAAAAWAGLENPPGEILRLDDSDLENDPDRLAIELQTMPMFGGRKVIRATTGRRINANVVKPLVSEGPLPATLIVEAGNLKPTDAMRKVFEGAAHAAALACFPDEDRDLAVVVKEEMSRAGLRISPEAEDLLVTRLGADRALSRGEIEKLALYCLGRKEVTVDDIEAIVGDASEMALDRIVMAAANGNPQVTSTELARALAAGESAQGVILAVQRHFIRLHRVRAEIDAGRNPAEAAKVLRPPLHFKQRDMFMSQLRIWTGTRLTQANSLIADTAKQARSSSNIEDVLAERLLLSLAHIARPAPAASRRA